MVLFSVLSKGKFIFLLCKESIIWMQTTTYFWQMATLVKVCLELSKCLANYLSLIKCHYTLWSCNIYLKKFNNFELLDINVENCNNQIQMAVKAPCSWWQWASRQKNPVGSDWKWVARLGRFWVAMGCKAR